MRRGISRKTATLPENLTQPSDDSGPAIISDSDIQIASTQALEQVRPACTLTRAATDRSDDGTHAYPVATRMDRPSVDCSPRHANLWFCLRPLQSTAT